MAEREELSKLEELARNISDSEEEDSDEESEDDNAEPFKEKVEEHFDQRPEYPKELESLDSGMSENPQEGPPVGEQMDFVTGASEAAAPVSEKDLARLEAGRLEQLAMEISESEDEESDESGENEPVTVASKISETPDTVAGLIEQIENAAHTSSIVLEREDSQEPDEDVDQDNYITNVDLENLNPGDVFDVELDQSQLEYLGEKSPNGDDIVDQSEQDNYDDDEEEEEEEVNPESESSSDDEMPKTFEAASELCDNYLDHLNHMLTYLVRELERNLARQEEIDTQVFELQQEQSIRAHIVRSQHVSVSKKSLTVFGYPYFKDKNLFHPPENSDTKAKKSKKELDPWIENPRPFTKQDKINLKMYVKEDAIRRRLAPLETERDTLTEKVRRTAQADREELENRLAAVLRKMQEVKRTPEEELFQDRFHSNFDWDRISVTNFNSAHTPRECQLQWMNLVHPDINRGVWGPEEVGFPCTLNI